MKISEGDINNTGCLRRDRFADLGSNGIERRQQQRREAKQLVDQCPESAEQLRPMQP